jgi:hypothetical protein
MRVRKEETAYGGRHRAIEYDVVGQGLAGLPGHETDPTPVVLYCQRGKPGSKCEHGDTECRRLEKPQQTTDDRKDHPCNNAEEQLGSEAVLDRAVDVFRPYVAADRHWFGDQGAVEGGEEEPSRIGKREPSKTRRSYDAGDHDTHGEV